MITNIPVSAPEKSYAQNICIFGWAFNPPQMAHANLIGELLEHPSTEKVIVLPSWKRADKEFGISDKHRIAMIREMVSEIVQRYGGRVDLDLKFVESPELETTTRNEYAHTLKSYGTRVSHVFWSDVLEAMTTWWDRDKKTGENTLFVAKTVPKTIMMRPGYERVSPETASKLDNIRAIIVPRNPMEVSSTHVRKNVSSVADLLLAVPEKVADYIIEHKLYNFA